MIDNLKEQIDNKEKELQDQKDRIVGFNQLEKDK